MPAWNIFECPPERLLELFALRARVWIAAGADPGAFPGGRWCDERDAGRRHWIALVDGVIVAGASLGVHTSLADVEEAAAYAGIGWPGTGPVAAPARVVVTAGWRGSGIVTGLLDRQDEAARAAGAVLAIRQASPMLRPLLERRGWCCHGPGPADSRFPGIRFEVMSWQLWPGTCRS
ncbi:MAG: hypothetical protein FJ191_03820 [Gammaproteobacteria bacterium]|nr:hypothetical protein [Gammaproteobacteria bacterium]